MDTKSLHFDKTIKNWDEALPLGNGDLGCLIWNSADKLRFSLDKGGIWDCSNPPEDGENFTYADIKNLVANKKQKKIQKKYDDCYSNPTPTKLPAGKLILNLGTDENIVSNLNLMTAEAELKVGEITVKSFIHANKNYGLISVNRHFAGIKIENPKYGKVKKLSFKFSSKGTVQSLKNLHYPDCEFFSERDGDTEYRYFVQPINDGFYGIMTAVKCKNGKTLIAYTVDIGKDRSFVEKCKKTVAEAICGGYQKAFDEHKQFWTEFWQKSSVELPDKLLEKGWYTNNYLLGSCSRKHHFPMPL